MSKTTSKFVPKYTVLKPLIAKGGKYQTQTAKSLTRNEQSKTKPKVGGQG